LIGMFHYIFIWHQLPFKKNLSCTSLVRMVAFITAM
jgi:hypothetical protein